MHCWLQGDLVENTDHRYVAKKDGLLSSKLLQRLYGGTSPNGYTSRFASGYSFMTLHVGRGDDEDLC
jgi:hypothetical protein